MHYSWIRWPFSRSPWKHRSHVGSRKRWSLTPASIPLIQIFILSKHNGVSVVSPQLQMIGFKLELFRKSSSIKLEPREAHVLLYVALILSTVPISKYIINWSCIVHACQVLTIVNGFLVLEMAPLQIVHWEHVGSIPDLFDGCAEKNLRSRAIHQATNSSMCRVLLAKHSSCGCTASTAMLPISIWEPQNLEPENQSIRIKFGVVSHPSHAFFCAVPQLCLVPGRRCIVGNSSCHNKIAAHSSNEVAPGDLRNCWPWAETSGVFTGMVKRVHLFYIPFLTDILSCAGGFLHRRVKINGNATVTPLRPGSLFQENTNADCKVKCTHAIMNTCMTIHACIHA